jgi:hypothetical protein
MSYADLLRAELRVAELEQALVKAKEDGTVTSEQKDELREARRVFRKLREGGAVPEDVATPAAINASTEVK